jgi:two-component system chemotaxis response regulator CheB
MISSHKDLEVVALASNAGEALDALGSVKVDIVLLDVEMPGTTGLQVLPEILKRGNGAKVIIVSSIADDGAEAAVRALAMGAADTLPKPGTGNFGGRFADVLCDRLRRIGRAGHAAPAGTVRPDAGDEPPIALRTSADCRLGCLALGASTGGLYALGEFLRALPPRIGRSDPHHAAPAARLHALLRASDRGCGRPTDSGCRAGAALVPEQILVAPGDAHLGVERIGGRVVVRLGDAPASSGCMPSVDSMFWSVSEAYGRSAVGVVFSGMGRDGLVGSARWPTAAGRSSSRISRAPPSGACPARSPKRGSPPQCSPLRNSPGAWAAVRRACARGAERRLQPHSRGVCWKPEPGSS